MPPQIKIHRKSSGVVVASVRNHRWPNGTVTNVSVHAMDEKSARTRLLAKLGEYSDPSIWKPNGRH